MLDKKTFWQAVKKRPAWLLLPIMERGGFGWLSDARYLKLQYWMFFGETLNFNTPKTFNEKIAWLKAYDHRDIYRDLANKLDARSFVAQHLGENWLVPLLGRWDSVDQIHLKNLPHRFVLKCVHGYGGTILCRDKDALDWDAAKQTLEKTMNTDFHSRGREWAYYRPQTAVIAETFMDDGGGQRPADYKFMCFNGIVKYVCISRGLGDFDSGVVSFLYPDGSPAPFRRADYPPCPPSQQLPEQFETMKWAAEHLAQVMDLPFVRVDFYEVDGHIFFSEFTFYPCGGSIFFDPPAYNAALGNLLALPQSEQLGKKASSQNGHPHLENQAFKSCMEKFPALKHTSQATYQKMLHQFRTAETTCAAEPMDFLKYQFYRHEEALWHTFLTRKEYTALCSAYNTAKDESIIANKCDFTITYAPFLGRMVVPPHEENRLKFDALCNRFEEIMIKPIHGGYGKHVEKVHTGQRDLLWQRMLDNDYIAEEIISQHSDMASFHPQSLNTIRLAVATSASGTPTIVAAVFRCGRNASITDNNDGLFAGINTETGLIETTAKTHFGEQFFYHPNTGKQFQGSKIPHWDALQSMVPSMASILPNLRIINWDIALTAGGEWALIEGNVGGGFGPCQEAWGIGRKAQLQAILGH